MMIPPVAHNLIAMVHQHQPGIRSLFDPLWAVAPAWLKGSWQVLQLSLNPLARLMTQAKTTAWDPEALKARAKTLLDYV